MLLLMVMVVPSIVATFMSSEKPMLMSHTGRTTPVAPPEGNTPVTVGRAVSAAPEAVVRKSWYIPTGTSVLLIVLSKTLSIYDVAAVRALLGVIVTVFVEES